MFSVSPFLRRIFFWECTLRFFLIFYINLWKITLWDKKWLKTKFSKKTLDFLKIIKSGQEWGFLEFCQKRLRRFFSFWVGILSLIVSFNPPKSFRKNISFRSYFKSKMHRGSLMNDPLLYILYLTQKRMDLAETFKKWSFYGFETSYDVSSVLTKSCLRLPNILLLNDPFSII